jgi:hypothetical protein
MCEAEAGCEELVRAKPGGVIVDRGCDDQLVGACLLDERLEAALHRLL